MGRGDVREGRWERDGRRIRRGARTLRGREEVLYRYQKEGEKLLSHQQTTRKMKGYRFAKIYCAR